MHMDSLSSDIGKARLRIADLIRQTPLEYARLLSQETGCQVHLKLENRQVAGSFKIRGAANMILSLAEEGDSQRRCCGLQWKSRHCARAYPGSSWRKGTDLFTGKCISLEIGGVAFLRC